MTRSYSLLLKNGRVVSPALAFPTAPEPDPHTGVMPDPHTFSPNVDCVTDIALWGGVIAEIGQDLNPDIADETIDLSGMVVIPGIIDSHVHVSPVFGGLEGHKMLAKAGVTTAVDMAGPSEDVFRGLQSHGVGLNILSVEGLIPGRRISSESPTRMELESSLERAILGGSLGMKIIGEPYGLTPEATAEAIALCSAWDCYCAVHAGTTQSSSDLNGFREILELAQGNRLYIAHLNLYCRGMVAKPEDEAASVLALLSDHQNVYTDSYLSPYIACSAKIVDGKPKSVFARTALRLMEFSEDEDGVRKAIMRGMLAVSIEKDGEFVLVTGESGVEAWRAAGTRINTFAMVNPLVSRLRLATAKYQHGERRGDFILDCLCSDGGGLARNVTVESGLALVRLGGLTLEDFIRKTSINPATMLGLSGKGRIEGGMDADLTVLDLERGKPVYSIAGGQVVLRNGVVCGTGGTAWVLPEGRAFVRNLGLNVRIVENSGLLPERI